MAHCLCSSISSISFVFILNIVRFSCVPQMYKQKEGPSKLDEALSRAQAAEEHARAAAAAEESAREAEV